MFSRSFFFIAMLIFPLLILAQKRGSQVNEDYLDGQFWIGLRTGANLSKAVPKDRYSIYSPTVENAASYEKEYSKYKKVGINIGLDITYSYKGFSACFHPNFQRMNASFKSQVSWQDSGNSSQALFYRYNNVLTFDYFEFPLYFKYEYTKAKLWPYALLGISYSRLIGGARVASVWALDKASGSVNEFELANYSSGSKAIFIPSLARANLGLGVAYPIENIKVCADLVYRLPIHQITDAAKRYQDPQLMAAGDLMDNLTLRSWTFTLSCLIPMKFLYDKHYRAF